MLKENSIQNLNIDINIEKADIKTLEQFIILTESEVFATIKQIRLKNKDLADALEKDLETTNESINNILEKVKNGDLSLNTLLETMYRNKIFKMKQIQSNLISLRDWGNRKDPNDGISFGVPTDNF